MRPDKEAAKAAGIPKSFRQYNARYGKGIFFKLQEDKKYRDVGTLDHGRDRQIAKEQAALNVAPLPMRAAARELEVFLGA